MLLAMTRVLIWAGSLVAVVVGLVFAADWYLLRRKYEPVFEQYAADAQAHLPRFEALGERAHRHPFFAQQGPDEDAGPFFNPRLPWEPASPGSEPAELELPEEVLATLKAWGPGWFEEGTAQRYLPADTGWMAGLSRYGYWNIVRAPPDGQAPVPFHSMAIPNFLPLQAWSKLRLIRGALDGDMEEALSQTRQLARLVRSSETLIAEMVSLAILRQELQLPPRQGIPWASSDELDAWKALIWTATLYAGLTVPAELYRRAFPEARAVPGHCSALTELAGSAVALRAAVGEDFADRYALLDQALARGVPGCRLHLARYVAGIVPPSSRPLDGMAWLAGGHDRLPFPADAGGLAEGYLARRIALILLAVAVPGGFERHLGPATGHDPLTSSQ
jgi:hypothetical protein